MRIKKFNSFSKNEAFRTRSSNSREPIVINISGPDGNAYVLLGYAKNFAKQLGLNYETIKSEMMSGDYDNLLNVFDRYFGDFVILERTEDDEDSYEGDYDDYDDED
jgi:hypothetical protein